MTALSPNPKKKLILLRSFSLSFAKSTSNDRAKSQQPLQKSKSNESISDLKSKEAASEGKLKRTQSSPSRPTESQARLEEKKYAAKIEEYLKGEKLLYKKRKREPVVLILGSSDSGKSTLLKQMKILHGDGFTPQERISEKRKIRANCLYPVITLLEFCAAEFESREMAIKYQHLPPIYEKYLDGADLVDTDVASFKSAWNEPVVQSQYEAHANALHESTFYFMAKIDTVFSADYTPPDDDILNLRTVTRMVSDNTFLINKKNVLHVIDVSGLAHHRKTWIPYFDDVTTIIFIASLSCYDQTMVEDQTVNRMVDSIVLFHEMANHNLLLKKPFILFLNKKDLYQKKIKTKHIVDYFPNYKGPKEDAAAGIKYFDSKIRDANLVEREIVTHVTCATDTKVMNVIIKNILLTLLNGNLETTGFV